MSAKAPANLLTPEQHVLFDEYVKKWQVRLGLQGWRIERVNKKTKAMAEVLIHHQARLAIYRVGDFGSAKITPQSIESTVVHELLHVLLYSLVNQGPIELVGEPLEAEEHRVIHTLEGLLVPVPLPVPAGVAP